MKHRIRPGCVPVLKAHKSRSQRVIMYVNVAASVFLTKMFGFETEADGVICSHEMDEEGF